jgi:hypothetical protein
MFKNLKDLQFSILISLVLIDLLNCDMLTGLSVACFVNNSERAISNNLFCGVTLGHNLQTFQLGRDWPWLVRCYHISQIGHLNSLQFVLAKQ